MPGPFRTEAALRRMAAAALAASVAGCSVRPLPAPVPPSGGITGGPTTLLTTLGTDTIAVEQYTRTATRIDGVLVTRMPVTAVSRYAVQLAPNGAPVSGEYSVRRGDGSPVPGAMPSLSVRYGADSVTLVGHRAAGDTVRTNPARGALLPYVNGSYGLLELALARMLAAKRDSADFAIVPFNFNVRNTSPLPMRRYARDSVRYGWFGYPFYARHDGAGTWVGLDGRQSTIKVRVERVAALDVETLGRAWAAREATAGVAGATSTRDTARATIGGAHVWVDYGRPALRGREVWVNGVLGDTIWRTGANAATQLSTDADLLIGGQRIPAGTYSLWTWAGANGYHLIVNGQAGQWGTEYHPDRDVVRVPLRETSDRASAERFTMSFEPTGPATGLLVLAWGTKRLSVPVAIP